MLKSLHSLTRERLAKGGPGSGRYPKGVEKPEHPAHYFQGSKERVAELQGRAKDGGLIDIENEDLTSHGLKAKMQEWDEGEHGVPSDIYDRSEAQLKESGETMPEGIRRLGKMAKGGPGSGRYPKGSGGKISGSGKITTPNLSSVDTTKLNPIEQREFKRLSQDHGKEESLQVIINTVEGDWSQLSEQLKSRAERDKTFKMMQK